MEDLFRLDGRVAVVTGALGTIGRTYAKSLAQYGADVALIDLQESGAEDLLEELSKYRKKVSYYPVDLTDTDRVRQTVELILRDFGQIDILLNHAGINIRKDAINITTEDWDKVMNINLKAMFFMAQTVGKHMISRGYGKIINTASVSSVRGHSRLAIYAASKGGIVQMTKVLAHEWAPYNVHVNAIGPGYILTQQTEGYLSDPEVYQSIVSKIPMGRIGRPEDLVGGLIYLASRASDYVTGHTLFIEGGRLID